MPEVLEAKAVELLALLAKCPHCEEPLLRMNFPRDEVITCVHCENRFVIMEIKYSNGAIRGSDGG